MDTIQSELVKSCSTTIKSWMDIVVEQEGTVITFRRVLRGFGTQAKGENAIDY
jgi:hypothetical protein